MGPEGTLAPLPRGRALAEVWGRDSRCRWPGSEGPRPRLEGQRASM